MSGGESQIQSVGQNVDNFPNPHEARQEWNTPMQHRSLPVSSLKSPHPANISFSSYSMLKCIFFFFENRRGINILLNFKKDFYQK